MDERAVAVGFCCVDVYDDGRFYATGNGVDWAVHLARAGVSCGLVSAVGDDKYADAMFDLLKRERIDATHLERRSGKSSQMIMGLRGGTDRVHLEAIDGVMENYHPAESDEDYIRSFSWLHTDLFGGALDRLKSWRDLGIHTVVDLSVFAEDPEYHVDDFIEGIEYAFLSFEGSKDDAGKLIEKLQAKGPNIVVATLGDKGSLAFDGECLYEAGIVETEVVNTVGAGDSYIAGFCLGLMQGKDIPACMRQGAELSAEVIGNFEPY